MSPRFVPQVDLHIETLVLDGVAPGDPRVAEAIERTTRKALGGLAPSAKPEAIGNAVSAAVAKRGSG